MNTKTLKRDMRWGAGRQVIVLFTICLLLAAGCTVGDAQGQSAAGPRADVQHEFRLRTGIVDGRMVFVGAGGAIDGLVNPELVVGADEIVRIILENGDGMMHDLAIPGLGVQTDMSRNRAAEITFDAGRAGMYLYFCTVSGHRQAGMEGTLVVR